MRCLAGGPLCLPLHSLRPRALRPQLKRDPLGRHYLLRINRTMAPYRPFHVIFAAVCCFLAGVALTLALEPGPWTRADTFFLVVAAALLLTGSMTLRGLYRSQRAAG